jgi:hypothetical protein
LPFAEAIAFPVASACPLNAEKQSLTHFAANAEPEAGVVIEQTRLRWTDFSGQGVAIGS